MLAAAAIAAAQAEDPALRRSVQAFYTQGDRLASAGDWKSVLGMYSPSFVMVDKQGAQTGYAEFKSHLHSMEGTRDMKSITSVKQVQGNSQEAMAWIEMTWNFKLKQGTRWVAMKKTTRWTETLKSTGNGWKITYAQELPTNEPWNFGG